MNYASTTAHAMHALSTASPLALDPARLDPARLDPARLDPARLDAGRLGLAIGLADQTRADAGIFGMAKRLYATRKVRDDLLGGALFSEPAWDILLDLFISEHEHRQLSVSAVCIGARAPSATALRYLTMLQDADLVERTRDERDGRRSHVRLTQLGRRRMASLLARLVE